jgi:hypothetical protein
MNRIRKEIGSIVVIAIAIMFSIALYGNALVPVQAADKVALVGDVDCKGGQTKDFEKMKDVGVTTLVIVGDFEYTDSKCIADSLAKNGFNKDNTIVSVGNHDKCSDVKKFMGVSSCWYHQISGNVDFIVMDGNQDLKKDSKQYDDIIKWIDESEAKYQMVVIHQPFVTVKSTHKDNGQFKTYNPSFDGKVEIVAQAHNHNYQRFMVGNVTYLLVGTGWHDSGKNMYPVSSDGDQYGNKADAKITGKNGFTLVDFGAKVQGRFIGSVDGAVYDSFSTAGNNQTVPPIDNGTIPIHPSNGTIDTETNEVCVCTNTTNPPVVNETKPIAQNVTVNIINNATDINKNFTKIITDVSKIALIPTKNNTEIQILANLSSIIPVEPLPPTNMTQPPVINNTLPNWNISTPPRN